MSMMLSALDQESGMGLVTIYVLAHRKTSGMHFGEMLTILAALSIVPSVSSVDLASRSASCGTSWALRVSQSVTLHLAVEQSVDRNGVTPGRVAMWAEGRL